MRARKFQLFLCSLFLVGSNVWAAESESRPDLIPVLWMTVSSDGTRKTDGSLKLDGAVHVVQSQPFLAERDPQERNDGRSISHYFQISNSLGATTTGHFVFRHPFHGVIENYHVAGTSAAGHEIDEGPMRQNAAFFAEIRLPIDEVSEELIFTLLKDIEDLNKRVDDAKKAEADFKKKNRRWVGPAPMAIDAQVSLGASVARRSISQDDFKKQILNPAFEVWKKIFDAEKGEEWAYDKRLDDEIELFRYLDKNIDAFGREYRQTKEHQKTYRQEMANWKSGDAIPAPPPPPAPLDPKIAKSEVRILQTEGVPAATIDQPNRIKFAVVAEAFTAAQKELFFAQAQKKWNFLFGGDGQKGVPPINSYKSYFTGVAIFVASEKSGSFHPDTSDGDDRQKTVFESSFDVLGQERLTGISRTGQQRLSALLAAKLPNYSGTATVLINDDEYGGSGGSFATVSVNEESNEILAHELIGHTFAKLGDEYDDPPYPQFNAAKPQEDPNTTKDPVGSKWASRKKEPSTPDTIPVDDLISQVFSGARYDAVAWFRPFNDCKMRELKSEFCPVCRDSIVETIYNFVKPIDDWAPTTTMRVRVGADWNLSVKPMQPQAPARIAIEWTKVSADGSEASITNAAGESIAGKSLNLGAGEYTIRAHVRDTNADYAPKPTSDKNLLEIVREWKVQVI